MRIVPLHLGPSSRAERDFRIRRIALMHAICLALLFMLAMCIAIRDRNRRRHRRAILNIRDIVARVASREIHVLRVTHIRRHVVVDVDFPEQLTEQESVPLVKDKPNANPRKSREGSWTRAMSFYPPGLNPSLT